MKHIIALFLIIAFSLSLSGCGKKTPLKKPGEEPEAMITQSSV